LKIRFAIPLNSPYELLFFPSANFFFNPAIPPTYDYIPNDDLLIL
jgi:hypothetical protein